jgi:hypothetical protein
MVNFATEPVRSVPKPSHKRYKPRSRTRGAISPKVRKELKERSGGICERCNAAQAVHAAHLTRRWLIETRTTVNDLSRLCVPCHINADQTKEGREWLEWFKSKVSK